MTGLNLNQGNIIHILFAIIGLLIGLALERNGGWAYGLLSGLALGLWIRANTQIIRLQKELSTLSGHFYDLSKFIEKTQGVFKSESAEHVTQEIHQKDGLDITPSSDNGSVETVQHEAVKPEPVLVEKQQAPSTIQVEQKQPQAKQAAGASESSESYTPLPIDRALTWLKNFFSTGNVLVKVGVLVLFFGIAFLVKYAAERNVLPVELRLAGVGLIGIVMLVIGWRLRLRKTGYALVLQGGALAVLYLTVFSALRLYSLMPATLAFSILFIFAAFSAALAVLQNSRSLAVLGISGGFIAPILTSTGSGSYIALFSYYLVLNLGIFGIAWFRSWRLLNIIGFMFTFVVATAWGVKNYVPEYFATTEPFLITFYLLYVAIAVLFAFKQPVQLKGYVDSSLVFGVPLAGFGLQAGMVGHIEYALAWSSLCLAVLYIGLASMLWHRLRSESRLLCEAFIAIGIMFATLVVPFALDARWTAGTWALEGAAAVWIGSRQSRLLPRLLGYALQLAGGFAYLSTLESSGYGVNGSQLFIINGEYIGAVVVALSGLFVAWRLSLLKNESESSLSIVNVLLKHEHKLSVPFLVWGLIWWYAAGVNEIFDNIPAAREALVLILFMSFSFFITQWFKDKLNWSVLRLPALGLLPVLYIIIVFVLFESDHPFANWNLLSWSIALTAHFWILKRYDDQTFKSVNNLHIAGFWFIVLLLTVESAWQVNEFVEGANIWWLIMTGLVPTLFMVLMYLYGQKISWPVKKHLKLYQLKATLPMGIAIWGWFVLMNLFNDGNASPINYLPIINPLDIVLAIQLLVLIYWLRFPLNIEKWGAKRWRFDYSQIFIALSVFLWLNTIWLRTAHNLWGIEFESRQMMNSSLVQAGVSILWGVTGLLSMIYGAKKIKRHVWIAGVVVMAAVVIKLFMFDLANSGTVERIVSFISVGLLFLVVGYFAPVPPAPDNSVSDEEKSIDK